MSSKWITNKKASDTGKKQSRKFPSSISHILYPFNPSKECHLNQFPHIMTTN